MPGSDGRSASKPAQPSAVAPGAAGLVLALLLAGCGGGAGGTTPPASAGGTTPGATTGQVATTGPASASSTAAAMTGTRLMDELAAAASKEGSYRSELTGIRSVRYRSDVSLTGSRASISARSERGSTTLRAVGGRLYAYGLNGLPVWVVVSPLSLGEALALMPATGKTFAFPAVVPTLRGAALTRLGRDTLAGAEAEHYRYRADLGAHAAQLGGEQARAAARLGKPVTVDLWVRSSLPVRLVMSIAGHGELARLTYSRWGEPVQVSAPPADQVRRAG